MDITSRVSPLAETQKPWMVWTGRVLSALPVLALLMGVVSGLTHNPQAVAGMQKFGYPESKLTLIATLEVVCAVLYIIPQTAVLGAIMLTAYFGGAVATHVRISDPGYPLPIICGILVWAGLYLRDARIRALLPLRSLR